MCDAIKEEVSRALCCEYLARYGRVLNYNADKSLLVAGRTEAQVVLQSGVSFQDVLFLEFYSICLRSHAHSVLARCLPGEAAKR